MVHGVPLGATKPPLAVTVKFAIRQYSYTLDTTFPGREPQFIRFIWS